MTIEKNNLNITTEAQPQPNKEEDYRTAERKRN